MRLFHEDLHAEMNQREMAGMKSEICRRRHELERHTAKDLGYSVRLRGESAFESAVGTLKGSTYERQLG